MTNHDQNRTGRRFFFRWVRLTFAGYLLGFVLTMLGLIAGEVIGLPEFQIVVGAAMGAGVGFTQNRLARNWLAAGRLWAWASVLGLGASFLIFDLAALVWGNLPNRESLQLDIALGGLLVGLLQWRVLARHMERAGWWVLASVVGWTLAGRVSNVTFSGDWDALLNLGMILLGGVVLGVVTGGVLVWMVGRSQTHETIRIPKGRGQRDGELGLR